MVRRIKRKVIVRFCNMLAEPIDVLILIYPELNEGLNTWESTSS